VVGPNPYLGMRTRELQGKQTMSNTVATPILTIKAIAVNKDFWNGGVECVSWIRWAFSPTKQYLIKGWREVLDKCLLIFDNVRPDSEKVRSANGDNSKTAKSIGLHKALF